MLTEQCVGPVKIMRTLVTKAGVAIVMLARTFSDAGASGWPAVAAGVPGAMPALLLSLTASDFSVSVFFTSSPSLTPSCCTTTPNKTNAERSVYVNADIRCGCEIICCLVGRAYAGITGAILFSADREGIPELCG